MDLRMRSAVAVAAAAMISCGSGAISGDDWIARSFEDTLTVAEVSIGWSGLDSAARATYAADGNQSGAYVEALAYRMLLERALRNGGYLDSPRIVSFERSWLRTESASAMRRILEERVTASIAEEGGLVDSPDQSDTFWFSMISGDSSGVELGPFSRFELPPGLTGGIDPVSPGMLLELPSGQTVRLDSMKTAASDSRGAPVAGPVPPDGISTPIVVQGRLRFMFVTALAGMKAGGSVHVDTLVMDGLALLYADSATIPDMPEPLLECDYGTWTAGDIAYEIEFFQTRLPFSPTNRYWMGFVLDNILQQCYFESMLMEEAPSVRDSLIQLAEEYALGTAMDEMRKDSVISRMDPGLEGDPEALAEATDSWLARLAAGQGLEIDGELLGRLPADPGEWPGILR